jgi:hypothetical protein
MADRVVLSHVNPAVSLLHADTAHVHLATLTFNGTYYASPAYEANGPRRYIDFDTAPTTYVTGLGLVRIALGAYTHAPGLALPVHPISGDGLSVDNSRFVGGNTTDPGFFTGQFEKKVAPFTKGFTFAYTFTINRASGAFAGANGGGKVEVKLVPKPPLSAKAPAHTQYTGKCTVRFQFSPSTVLT